MSDAGTASPGRDTSRDGLRNKLENAVMSGFRPVWAFVNRHRRLARYLNRIIIGSGVLKAPARPLALSTMKPYTCWSSLTDRTWFARYLPPADAADLPPPELVATLFKVRSTGPRVSGRSTLLFPCFAQWFTDGFLMTEPDRRRTSTTHQINLNQIYGTSSEATQVLRQHSERLGQKGRLLSETTATGEWPPRLFDAAGMRRPEFAALPDPVNLPQDWPLHKKATIFALGGRSANSTAYTSSLSTLFLREHNRLCGVLEAANSLWDDERVFQIARNINIVQLIKVVIEEYINHISPYWFNILADPTVCYTATWNRENWIPVEFNLLYRWHSLVPEDARWDETTITFAEMRFDNSRPLQDGLGAAFDSASRSAAWQIGLFNTTSMLESVELASIKQGRDNQLASYNDYRERMGYPRVTRFEQISGDTEVVDGLKRVYKHVDKIEFFPGLFAEDLSDRAAVPPLISRMVAVDAFSHALTNPLLSPHVYNEGTFTPAGMQSIAATATLKDLLERNGGVPADIRVSMEREGYHSVARE